MIGRTLSHYRIVAELGSGGMGRVYLAEDTRLGRRVAIKVLPEELSGDAERLERLEREARALAALDHPNIVTLHSVEEAEDLHFLTMAYVEGETLAELIPPRGLPAEDLLEWAIPLVDAVRVAHQHGIVHRDLKPGNVMVDTEGRLRVLDFGLAKVVGPSAAEESSQLPTEAMTRDGAILGTYPYMSPEQVEGRPADERSDIFALGVMLYEMATGERPFGGASSASLIAAILREEPRAVDQVRPELPHHLGRIIGRCLAKDPEERYQRSRDLLHELRELGRETTSGASAPAAKPPTRPKRRNWLVASAIAAVVFVTGLVLYFATKSPAPAAPQGAKTIRSIAVLPLDNLMNDPEQEYFVDGMTEALITDLAKLGGLEVISRTSVMHYKGTEKTVPEIARELGVDALLEGSVLRSGDAVRITAQLIDATTDTHLWAETYDRTVTDVLALHSEVARAVAREIELHLTPGEQQRLVSPETVDPAAYESYLKGKFHISRFTPSDLEIGSQLLQRAIEIDPEFAPAHAAVATLNSFLMSAGLVPPMEAAPRLRRAAQRALEIDETNAEAHVALGYLLTVYDHDFPSARREIERAVELSPNYAYGYWGLGALDLVAGEFTTALEEMRTARRLDPLEPLWSFGVGWCLVYLGRDEEAMAPLRRSIELNPEFHWGHGVLGYVLMRQGRERESIREFEQYYRLIGLAEATEALAETYDTGGFQAAFRVAARRLEVAARGRFVSPSEIAVAWAQGNDRDRAFAWLERAVEEHDAYVYQFRRDLGLVSLHPDPRFDELTRRLGLPD